MIIVVWGCYSKGLSQKLQKLQNRATRIITSSIYDSNTDELFSDLNWNKCNNNAIMVYNAVNNQTPDYLSTRFTPRHEVLSYSLGNAECKLSIPQPRTNYGKRSFSYSGGCVME